jgi:predicted dehydrogenase
MQSSPLRVGIVGMGNIGRYHANYLSGAAGTAKIHNATLSALCTRDPAQLRALIDTYGGPSSVAGFSSYEKMLSSGSCDAVLIATPHTDHPEKTLAAFKAGLHVMVEKPLGVSVKAAREVVDAYARYPHLKFGVMFNQRTNPMYRKLHELLQAGNGKEEGSAAAGGAESTAWQLGALTRITWIATHWFRPWSYYNVSKWRATWKGEGGGVVINQCAHNLDLLQWLVAAATPSAHTPPARAGLPDRVTAVGALGKAHPIETEDELSAIFEFPLPDNSTGGDGGGAIGHFITSTGEFPGSNRLEICGTRGRIIAENNTLTLIKSSADSRDFARSSPEPFSSPSSSQSELSFAPAPPPAATPASPTPSEHHLLFQNFVDTILNDLPNDRLLAPGTDAPKSLELGNAMLLSAFTRTPVNLPLDGDKFDAFLAKMIETSSAQQPSS